MKNLHAVLVHESRECVLDLVRNLHHLDPDSKILLYDGGKDPALLRGVDWVEYGAIVHPAPRSMRWGTLHDFALDCMRFGLDELGFDTLTIVDSDQLALRAGYSAYLAHWLEHRTGVGMLGSAPAAGPRPIAPPAAQALKERDLWRSFLRRFADGERKFVHWTFWPSTVFTAEAARGLLELWPDPELQAILKRTKIWATEEVILPTLVALLGLGIEVNPCRHDLVRYRVRYSTAELDRAMADAASFWVHPVPRRYDDPLRAHLRRKFLDYRDSGESAPAPAGTGVAPAPSRALEASPILSEIRSLEGWLSDGEAKLLIATASQALSGREQGSVVEVGSYCGKATVALARVVQAQGQGTRVAAIDPHDGVVGSRDGRLSRTGPTLEKFLRNIERAGVAGCVDVHRSTAEHVVWNGPIRLLVIDGLHDYRSVLGDFERFERWVAPGGFVAFHDYADYFPGVKRFVDELVGRRAWRVTGRAESLIVLQRRPAEEHGVAGSSPLVTCIMPTADRRQFVPLAIQSFLAQDYAERELVIVDDGREPVDDLVPQDARVRYLRLEGRKSIGEKRNLACAAARGHYVAHFDDDDWSSPSRLRYQLEELERSRASIGGLTQVNYYDPALERAFQYRYPPGRRPWVAGNTLFYTKAQWSKQPFEHVDVGEDARFIWADRTASVRVHERCDFFVALLHGSNVAKKQTHQRFWHPMPCSTIRALMGSNFERYREAAEARRSGVRERAG